MRILFAAMLLAMTFLALAEEASAQRRTVVRTRTVIRGGGAGFRGANVNVNVFRPAVFVQPAQVFIQPSFAVPVFQTQFIGGRVVRVRIR